MGRTPSGTSNLKDVTTPAPSIDQQADTETVVDAQAWPFYDSDEIEAVTSVLQSGCANQWTGHHVFAFEEEAAEYFGQPHAVALANGTLALELALIALEIGADDEVIVLPLIFDWWLFAI